MVGMEQVPPIVARIFGASVRFAETVAHTNRSRDAASERSTRCITPLARVSSRGSPPEPHGVRVIDVRTAIAFPTYTLYSILEIMARFALKEELSEADPTFCGVAANLRVAD